jgi:hypothetical protein
LGGEDSDGAKNKRKRREFERKQAERGR